MLGGMEVFGGVLILGGVAAADMAADQAHAEMHPPVAALEAFLASTGVGADILNLVEVGTLGSHEL
jgi:hypothetical protein